ncbi:hypothetical protein [Lacisediminihabitans changchengi]|uniref:Uncharacterized protein n=1 Tax=Lacisediminihabitans changchengi TaxID=2787634 RepID=A0A934SSI1_9MICO|nr:hypothetical protein [Lacisediminihabitans changchengi]MBK4347324.1 hypothetical protein [Lacisediminihabitans changchengi]
MDADLRSAIAHDESLRSRRRLSTALVVIAVMLFAAAWFMVPSGITILVTASSTAGIVLVEVGSLALVGGAIVLIAGLRMRRAVARDIHSPSSAPGKPDPHFQKDPAAMASPNPPYNWTGITIGGS